MSKHTKTRLTKSFLKKFFPDLERAGTPPNRYWTTQGREFSDLQAVVDTLGRKFLDLHPFIKVWPAEEPEPAKEVSDEPVSGS